MKVYRYINGISLNPREYLLDDKGNEIEFDNFMDIQNYLHTEFDRESLEVYEGIYVE